MSSTALPTAALPTGDSGDILCDRCIEFKIEAEKEHGMSVKNTQNHNIVIMNIFNK